MESRSLLQEQEIRRERAHCRSRWLDFTRKIYRITMLGTCLYCLVLTLYRSTTIMFTEFPEYKSMRIGGSGEFLEIVQMEMPSSAPSDSPSQVPSSVPSASSTVPTISTPTGVRQISIIGERHSGTSWIINHLNNTFGKDVKVTKWLFRSKHFFQEERAGHYPNNTLVIMLVRDPYDWFKAMEFIPHHAPAHMRTRANASCSIREAQNDPYIFLTKEWTMPRVGQDLNMTGDELCQEWFKYRDIVSCTVKPLPDSEYCGGKPLFSEHQPFYEMRNDGSGMPYNNIIEFRAAKLLNNLSVKDYKGVRDHLLFRYEDLKANGTAALLEAISNATGLTPKAEAAGPDIRLPDPARKITAEYAKFVRERVNWTVEEMIGYYPNYAYERAEK